LLDSQEQILTFATLANPSGPEAMRARRTPLFPVLWRRAIACFEGFDAKREFRLEVGEPLRRSSIFAAWSRSRWSSRRSGWCGRRRRKPRRRQSCAR